MFVIIFLNILVFVKAGPATESFKDQFCTDPRTMKKHAAYTEWADAYSCTRHRCQPGGRNLAIYTVGCKRVEAPESAIECEEVVEDTNMQFPYCCTRLRCLVVVRGEVWTRVLGQPWETLPAAPWSHMYKMKKPPPADNTFLSKSQNEGPVYELASDQESEKVLRANKMTTTNSPDGNNAAPRAVPVPDIVIALSTDNTNKEPKKKEAVRHRRMRKTTPSASHIFNEEHLEPREPGLEETPGTDKTDPTSEEKALGNANGVTQKLQKATSHIKQVAWTEIPQNQWNEHEPSMEPDSLARDAVTFHQADVPSHEVEKKDEKPSNLQALVDAIGTRMRDIESVVQRMSEKVHQNQPGEPHFVSIEKRSHADAEIQARKYHKDVKEDFGKAKRPNPDGEHYKRFSVDNRSKYLHSTTDSTTEQPLFLEDTNMNGYFSDASNSIVRRSNSLKEPIPTYMAPVENRRMAPVHVNTASDTSEDVEKKKKKHSHKKKKSKSGRGHKKHHGKGDKKKRYNRMNSIEIDRNVVSLEDSSAVVSR